METRHRNRDDSAIGRAAMTAEYLSSSLEISLMGAAYSAAASLMDARAMSSFFMPRAELANVAELVGLEKTDIIGAQAIGDFYGNIFKTLQFVQQTSYVVVREIAGNEAKTITVMNEHIRTHDGTIKFFLGHYDEILMRTNDGWKFQRRELQVKLFESI
jgi:hypothetical protein